MADPITVLGAVAGSTQLTSRIISIIRTTISFYQQVKDAPKNIHALLEDIETTSYLLERLLEDSDGDDTILRSLRTVKRILDDLQEVGCFSTEIRDERWKVRLRWGSLKVLGMDQMVSEMAESLERAKSSLHGALLHQIISACLFM